MRARLAVLGFGERHPQIPIPERGLALPTFSAIERITRNA